MLSPRTAYEAGFCVHYGELMSYFCAKAPTHLPDIGFRGPTGAPHLGFVVRRTSDLLFEPPKKWDFLKMKNIK